MTSAKDAASERRVFAGPFGEIAVHVERAARSGPGAIVFFHGGALAGAATAETSWRALAREAACTVLAIDSAQLSAPQFPQVVDEAYFIACALHEHADELGLDHRYLAIGGQGFGAGVATAVARLAKQRRNPALVLQLLLLPVVDLRTPFGELAEFAQRYLPQAADREDPRASPLLATNLIGLPPALVIGSEDDPQHAAAMSYLAALRTAHVEVQLEITTDLPATLQRHAAALQRALGRVD